jgi:predicted secreted Zn-dependent protease
MKYTLPIFTLPILLCSMAIASCSHLSKSDRPISHSNPPVQSPAIQSQPTTKPPTQPIPSNSPPTPISIPHAKMTYYEISGNTARQLRSQINTKRPKSHDAQTQWSIRWSWPGYGSKTCDLNTANVSYTIEVIMPRWKPPQGASPQLVTRWNDYIRALTLHERGHVDNVIENLPHVKKAIASATCETAESEAKARLDRIKQNDLDYDRVTNHGETQGARFP